MKSELSIGDLAARTGLSVSAIRFYEGKGLIAPGRNAGGQRRFARSDIRRLSFVMAAQKLGLSIADIRSALQSLPQARTPTAADWRRLSEAIRDRLDEQIALLERLRTRLDGCIGCGCLSLEVCGLYNPADQAFAQGPGPRFLLPETPETPQSK